MIVCIVKWKHTFFTIINDNTIVRSAEEMTSGEFVAVAQSRWITCIVRRCLGARNHKRVNCKSACQTVYVQPFTIRDRRWFNRFLFFLRHDKCNGILQANSQLYAVIIVITMETILRRISVETSEFCTVSFITITRFVYI